MSQNPMHPCNSSSPFELIFPPIRLLLIPQTYIYISLYALLARVGFCSDFSCSSVSVVLLTERSAVPLATGVLLLHRSLYIPLACLRRADREPSTWEDQYYVRLRFWFSIILHAADHEIYVALSEGLLVSFSF